MSENGQYYDELETRDPQTRRQAQFAALPGQINHAQQRSRAFARILADIDSGIRPLAAWLRLNLANLHVYSPPPVQFMSRSPIDPITGDLPGLYLPPVSVAVISYTIVLLTTSRRPARW
jgi:hypothetical protein